MMNELEWKELCFSSMKSDAFVLVNKKIISYIGLYSAAFLSILIDKDHFHTLNKTLTEDGFFFETIEDMEKITKLSRYDQDNYIRKLQEARLIVTDVRGLPARRHFRILYENVSVLLTAVCKETANFDIPNTYKEKEENEGGTVCKGATNLFVVPLQQVKTNIVKQEASNLVISETDIPTLETTRVGKKALKLRDTTKPLIAEPEPAEEVRKPIYRRLHPAIKLKIEVTSEIKEVLEYWESKGLSGHREGSGSYYLAVEHISKVFDGTLFYDLADKSWRDRKFTINQIKQAIDNFYLAAYKDDYEPANHRIKMWLRSIRPNTFFYNPYTAKDEFKSQFLCFLSKPRLVKNSILHPITDKYPNVTKILCTWYIKEFGSYTDGTISPKLYNDLIASAKRLAEFYDTCNGNLRIDDEVMRMYNQYIPLNLLAIQLTRCADKMLREGDEKRESFTPNWLSSENMLGERFPNFLRSERMMK